MKRLVLAVALIGAGEAAAQQVCLKPAPPVFPAPTTAGALAQPQIEQHRTARDTYFTAADANLTCLNANIESRMQTLFASGAPMDAELRRLGAAHEEASRERAMTYERFLRLCLAWEDARHTPLPGGCATTPPPSP
jgi:hypothetical protein